MSDNESRPYPCSHCGWIIGESYREPDKKIIKLRVYRHARSPEIGMDFSGLPLHKKYSTTRMSDGVVECDQCGAGTPWYANQTAISEMLMRKNLRRTKLQVNCIPSGT